MTPVRPREGLRKIHLPIPPRTRGSEKSICVGTCERAQETARKIHLQTGTCGRSNEDHPFSQTPRNRGFDLTPSPRRLEKCRRKSSKYRHRSEAHSSLHVSASERKPRPCGRQRLCCTRNADKPRSISRGSWRTREGTRQIPNFPKHRETRGFDLPPSPRSLDFILKIKGLEIPGILFS